MPKFKKNTSPAMKRSGFKMGGYSYPGVSPVKKKIKEEKFDADKQVDEDFQDIKGTQYDIDAHNVSAHKTEGSIKSQEKLLAKRKAKELLDYIKSK